MSVDLDFISRQLADVLSAQRKLAADMTLVTEDVTAIREAFEDEAVLRIVQERRVGSLERAVSRLAKPKT